MKNLFFSILFLLSIGLQAQDLVILHTNDMHSQLNGLSPEAEYTPLVKDNDSTRGGFSRIAGFIKSEKEKNGKKLLVVDAGDFLMGTLFPSIELTEGFQLNLMKKMGYEFAAIGNHEFDFGANDLAKIINNNLKNGEIPILLCANYKGNSVDNDADLKKLFEQKVILPYSVIEKNGYKIGLFGLVGVDADESINSNFGIEWEKQKKVAKTTAKYLKNEEKVDMVMVLSHSGVAKNKKGEWAGEDVEIGKAVPEIDLIISGHTHSYLPEALKAGNATILQTGSLGMNVGKVEVTFDENRKPKFNYHLVAMNDAIDADIEIQGLIDAKIPLIEKEILSKIGVGYSDIVVETSYELALDENEPLSSNLGPFVADAIYHQMNAENAPGVDIAMVASGVIRNNIKVGNSGKQNINDIFNVMPLGMGETNIPGSPLAKIYVTGAEFKKVIELILTVSPMKPSYYLFYSGVEIDYNPKKGLFKKVKAIRYGNEIAGFKNLDISKKSNEQISVVANSYMISFISELKKMSFGLVKVTPKTAEGVPIENNDFIVDLDANEPGIQEAKEWLSIYNYLLTFADSDSNGIPEIPDSYKSKTNPLFNVK